MNPNRWKQIDALLEAALELDPEQRSAFLDRACSGDDELRREVEVLLASDHKAGDFLHQPALHPAEGDVVRQSTSSRGIFSLLQAGENRKSLRAGQIVAGRYEIRSKLGSGGMGDVWLAHDRKLRVEVALKAIHSARRHDPVETVRSEVRRAREVISPNVCRIFDLVEAEEQELISMEYIDGMTLLALLQQKGPLTISEATDIASQFLSGLETIHQTGLVHCDLKPENIMITRTGRVVVMDFGIAREAERESVLNPGTIPYMAPERISGSPVDAKGDIFSAGVILAEIIHPSGIVSRKTREEIWSILHRSPQQLPESAWKSIILRATEPHPESRFHSAQTLARALEEATERLERREERGPYPGLASFAAIDAEYFFGRELEVENVIKELQQQHLMALVGASGAGKTSFLRAGLIPALPPGWSSIFCVPGDDPLLNLCEALERQLSSTTNRAPGVHSVDISTMLELLQEWRTRYTQAVLIVDRFEELFTLNAPEVQSQFASLMGKTVTHSDVRVLLSMRDDYLLRCHEHTALSPIFSELTPLGALTGPALRRALVQPALKCGYRFEDETMVDDILADVEKERGALPLLAFAAARLWDKRDRTGGNLTRKSYLAIGGIAGALALHAEETMERVGIEREPVVREIFRNLVTAENTRVARDAEDLMSIFQSEQRVTAEEVLRTLIDARLLTSYETANEGDKRKRRVEIIHESLLSNWPRLVHWQTQDADSARLRDQLRQASQIWEQKARPDDLLWTDNSFVEFELWRQRYTGSLTATENEFADAMTRNVGQRRRQRRIAVAAVFFILLGVLGLISNFWRDATVARDDAVKEAKRAEASKIITLGRAVSEADASARLAYAIASLESADTPAGRRFALEALSQGPVAQFLKISIRLPGLIEFTPDGRWLFVSSQNEGSLLAPMDGTSPVQFTTERVGSGIPRFLPDGKLMVIRSAQDPGMIHVWSLSEMKVVRTFQMEGFTSPIISNKRAFFITDLTGQFEVSRKFSRVLVRIWDFDDSEPKVVGQWDLGGCILQVGDSPDKAIAFAKNRRIYKRSLDESGLGPEVLLGIGNAEIEMVRFRPQSSEIVSSDLNGRIQFWSPDSGPGNPIREIVLPGGTEPAMFWFDSMGLYLVRDLGDRLQLWDLSAPEAALPADLPGAAWVTFDPKSRWMAAGGDSKIHFYPLRPASHYDFPGGDTMNFNVRFTPDGNSLVSSIGVNRIQGTHVISSAAWQQLQASILSLDVDPRGKFLVVGTTDQQKEEGVHILSLVDGSVRSLRRCLPGRYYDSVALSPDGEFAAAVGVHPPFENQGIEIWNLQSGDCSVIEASKRKGSFAVKYAPDGSLFSGDTKGNLYHWNLKDDSVRIIGKGKGIVSSIAVTKDGRFVACSTLSADLWGNVPASSSELVIYDLIENQAHQITSHGNRVFSVSFDPSGKKIITGDMDGNVRVGPVTGEIPHILIGHGMVTDVAVDSEGKWIAAKADRIRLWRMPQGSPFHTLPYAKFLESLRNFTNVRVVADQDSSTGYDVLLDEFPGWKETEIR